VRFADKEGHQVFLEPESLADDWVYCNGISTSLPADVQERIIRALPGCERAHIYRYGYAVEYDMVPPHQIGAHAMTKRVAGLFLAGQINGTSGYEEAAGQGLIAGANAAVAAALGAGSGLGIRVEAGSSEYSDHLPFAMAGIPAAFIMRLPEERRHTAGDVPASVDGRALAETTDLVEAAVRKLALDAEAQALR